VLPVWLNLLQNGNITFAFFTLVMFGGAFRKRSLPYKKILQVRRELAITGFIFLLPHAFLRLELALNGYNFTGLIAAIIMIPLVITSFTFVRKKMKPLTWKRVHYGAYVVFLMIYIHLGYVLFLFSGDITISYKESSILYHILFGIYLILKVDRILYHKRIKKV
jgi:DMSO/TMAO reductase YedYZ heme-binding membrane subunit